MPELPVNFQSCTLDTVQMSEVRNEKSEEKNFPHAQVRTRAQYQCLIQSEDEVHVSQLGKHNALARRNRAGECCELVGEQREGIVGQVHVLLLLVVGVVSTDGGGYWLNP